MLRRPTSVTVISCIEMAMGLLPLLFGALSLFRRAPVDGAALGGAFPAPVQYAISIASSVILLTSGYFMLGGKNWARWLCVGWSIFGPILALATTPYWWPLLPGVLYAVVIVYFLFRPEANRFFAADGAGYAPVTFTPRRVLSICCYLLSGFALASSCLSAFFWFPEYAAVAKLMMLAIFVLPAVLLLSIGRILSDEPNWKREAGIVLVVSAVAGAWFALSVRMLFADPAFQQRVGDRSPDLFSDYLTGGLWIAAIFLIGTLLTRQGIRDANTPPVRAPIPGSKRR